MNTVEKRKLLSPYDIECIVCGATGVSDKPLIGWICSEKCQLVHLKSKVAMEYQNGIETAIGALQRCITEEWDQWFDQPEKLVEHIRELIRK